MSQFDVALETARAAERLVADTGTLPEIVRASTDFFTAIEQTRALIDDGAYASRFNQVTDSTGNVDQAHRGINGEGLSPLALLALAEGGGTEVVRTHFQLRIEELAANMGGIIHDLTELRAQVIFAQTEDAE